MVTQDNAPPLPDPTPAARIISRAAARAAANALPHALGWWTPERPIQLADLPRVLPPRPNGKRVSVDAVYRWSLRGLHGIRLRRFRVGGAWCTTLEELARWTAAITAATETIS